MKSPCAGLISVPVFKSVQAHEGYLCKTCNSWWILGSLWAYARTGGEGGYGPMRTRCEQGGRGGPKIGDLVRTYLMDAPLQQDGDSHYHWWSDTTCTHLFLV